MRGNEFGFLEGYQRRNRRGTLRQIYSVWGISVSIEEDFNAYEALRADYLKVFDEEAPHVQPLEMDIMSGYIKEAIETGIPLEHPEGDYVT